MGWIHESHLHEDKKRFNIGDPRSYNDEKQIHLGIWTYHDKGYHDPKGDGLTHEAISESGKGGELTGDSPPVVPDVMFEDGSEYGCGNFVWDRRF